MSLCLLFFLEIHLFVANTIKEQLGKRWWPCALRDGIIQIHLVVQLKSFKLFNPFLYLLHDFGGYLLEWSNISAGERISFKKVFRMNLQ